MVVSTESTAISNDLSAPSSLFSSSLHDQNNISHNIIDIVNPTIKIIAQQLSSRHKEKNDSNPSPIGSLSSLLIQSNLSTLFSTSSSLVNYDYMIGSFDQQKQQQPQQHDDNDPTTLNLPYIHNVTFLLNVNRDIPEKMSVILFGYMFPLLFALTIVTNLLIVAVLSQQHMRTPTNLVLLGMAIADLLTLLIPSPWYIYLFTFGHQYETIYPVTKCYAFHWMYEVLPALFHTYSIWLTLLLAAQRYIYVCHFSLARRWCTVPQVMRAMMIILIFAVLYQLTRFFDRNFRPVHYLYENGQVGQGCIFSTSDWVMDYVGEDLYYIIYYGFQIVFVHTGPCILLVWLNVLLFRALHQTQKTRQRLLSNSRNHGPTPIMASGQYSSTIINNRDHNRDASRRSTFICDTNNNDTAMSNLQHGSSNDLLNCDELADEGSNEILSYSNQSPPQQQRQQTQPQQQSSQQILDMPTTTNGLMGHFQQHQKQQQRSNNPQFRKNIRLNSRSTTVMLIVIVTVFLFLEIPLAFTTILHVIQNIFSLELVNYNVLNTIIMMNNFFIIVSYPINFAIYCGMSRQFRITFHQSILAPFTSRLNWMRIRIYGFKYFRNRNNNNNNAIYARANDSNVAREELHQKSKKENRKKADNVQPDLNRKNRFDEIDLQQEEFTNQITGASNTTFGSSTAELMNIIGNEMGLSNCQLMINNQPCSSSIDRSNVGNLNYKNENNYSSNSMELLTNAPRASPIDDIDGNIAKLTTPKKVILETNL